MNIENINIEIQCVVEKCFYMKLFTENKEVYLENSSIFGNDAPNILIKALKWFDTQSNGTKYLRWYGESEAYIWILNKKNDVFEIEIWLGGEYFITVYEGEEALRDKKKILFSAITSYYYFVQNIKEAFHTYFDFKEERDYEYEINFRLLDSLKGY